METSLEAIINYFQNNLWATAVAVFLLTVLALVVHGIWESYSKPLVLEASPIPCGDITIDELGKFDGTDPFKPIYVAIKGNVYDVTKGRDFYGRDGGYSVFAGREVARALAKMSLKKDDCNAELADCTEKELESLAQWETKFKEKYSVVGKVVEPKRLTLAELLTYNGEDPKKPILLAIRGTIFDVSSGKEFYGPDGMYPFGGRECARAFALISTEIEDCHDNLEGLGAMELDNLREWEAKFYYKYPVVGSVVKG